MYVVVATDIMIYILQYTVLSIWHILNIFLNIYGNRQYILDELLQNWRTTLHKNIC